jgi:hypothetical protein
LRKVSDSLVNASSVLHSPTEAVLFQYLRQIATTETSFPNFNSLETWFVLAPLPCCALLLISSVFPHRRAQVLTMALAISTPRVQAFELKTPTPMTAPTTTVSLILQLIDTFRQHDLVLISLVIGIIVCMIIIATATHRALARRSFIYIDLSNTTQVEQLKFFCLPDSSRCYSVKLPRENTQLVFRSYFFFGVIAFTSPPWTLAHSLTKKQINYLEFCSSHLGNFKNCIKYSRLTITSQVHW